MLYKTRASFPLCGFDAAPIALLTTATAATTGNVAALQGVWSDGSPFTGGFVFAAPTRDVNGTYAVSGSELIAGPADGADAATALPGDVQPHLRRADVRL